MVQNLESPRLSGRVDSPALTIKEIQKKCSVLPKF